MNFELVEKNMVLHGRLMPRNSNALSLYYIENIAKLFFVLITDIKIVDLFLYKF